MEDIRRRRVIENDGVCNGTTKLREVLDIVALMGITGLSEEAVGDDLVNVELVKDGIGIL
jgi:hypothetical protein